MTHNKQSPALIKNYNIFDSIIERINSKEKGSHVIVPHICNNVNAFGAGFAADVSQKFPEVKMNFHMLGTKAKLGQVQFVSVVKEPTYKHEIIFANMIAQNNLLSKDNPRPLNYAALVRTMNEVKVYCQTLKKKHEESANVEIHAPKFGSGLAGGNWDFIACLIQDIWNDIPVYIYGLQAQVKPRNVNYKSNQGR